MLCGLAVGASQDATADRLELPVGSTAFVKAWLDEKMDQYQKRCRVLVQLAQADTEGAQHMALHLLRVSAMARNHHVLSSLTGATIDEWACALRDTTWRCTSDILNWPALTAECKDILALPLFHAGLGFCDFQLEAPVLYLSRSLQLRATESSASEVVNDWTTDERWVIDRLSCLLPSDLWLVLKQSEEQCRANGCSKAMKLLREAMYGLQPRRGNGLPPVFDMPADVSFQGTDVPVSVLQNLSMTWWAWPSASFLPNGVLQLVLRYRLNLPLHHIDAKCQNRKLVGVRWTLRGNMPINAPMLQSHCVTIRFEMP